VLPVVSDREVRDDWVVNRLATAVLAVAGVALGVLAYEVQMDNLLQQTTALRSSATVVAAWSFLVAGLVAWRRRPRNQLGPLMVLTCFALLGRQFRYSGDPLAFTVFFALGEVAWALVAHVALAYPNGRVTDRLERWFLGVAYAVALVFPFAILLAYDGTEGLRYLGSAPGESLVLLWGNADVVRVLQDAFGVIAYGGLAIVFILLVARKLVRATRRARRILAPLLIAAVVAAAWALLNGLLTFATSPPPVIHDLFWWQVVGLIALPLALLWGLLRERLARAHVGELVVQLEHASPVELRDELARTLDDPTLEVAFWLPERFEYVDADGRRVEVPDDSPTRAVTKLEQDGEPLAVLVHDPTLLEEPKLVEAVAAAARLALQNARLHAEVSAQLAKVKQSRSRIVAAADEERRRIERDIHDGAQQRLVALALELRSAQRRLGDEVDPELDALLASAADELQVAVDELRELAQGIHPGVLVQGGLAAALEALAGRSPLPVLVDSIQERLPAEVEGTAYFVASEALANVVKHARATRAVIRATRVNGTLVIEVEDDGVGGAASRNGSGLRGLADRVEAHGGSLRVESAPGSGTRVVGEIPCAS
jgi:signal transduction histidine kinase